MNKVNNSLTNIKYSDLLILNLNLVFFSRILDRIGFPGMINLVHYVVMIVVFFLFHKISNIKYYIFYLILITSSLISCIFNKISPLNAILDSIIIAQPIIIYSLLFSNNQGINKKVEKLFLNVLWINFFVCSVQALVFGLWSDDCVGIFFGMGAGSHVSGAMAIIGIIYGLAYGKNKWLYMLNIAVLVFVDNKQSIVALLITVVAYTVINITNVKLFMKYIFVTLLTIFSIYLLATTVFPAILGKWIYIQDGIDTKLSIFSEILNISTYTPVGFFFGLGPGCSVSRLSQMLPAYSILANICTISENFNILYSFNQANYLSNSITGSSMWMMLYTWSGIFGDLGIVGIIIVICGYLSIYRSINSSSSKIILLYFLVHGLIFQWMDEPVFATFVMLTIYVCENKEKLRNLNKKTGRYENV